MTGASAKLLRWWGKGTYGLRVKLKAQPCVQVALKMFCGLYDLSELNLAKPDSKSSMRSDGFSRPI
ncbi:hypothetical protein D3C80_1926420 [compost metagenome]